MKGKKDKTFRIVLVFSLLEWASISTIGGRTWLIPPRKIQPVNINPKFVLGILSHSMKVDEAKCLRQFPQVGEWIY